jgi:hypothetical protein
MLSSRNEWIVVGVLIAYLAFVPSLQIVRDLLATPVGKALGLAGIVYVHKYVSCPVALLLVIAYVRCAGSSWEGFTTPTTTVQPTCTCPDGYAYDSVTKECKPSSSMSGSVPPPPEASVGSMPGASVSMPPPNSSVSTAPMTTPMPTMPPVPPPSTSGVQPSMGMSSTVGSV